MNPIEWIYIIVVIVGVLTFLSIFLFNTLSRRNKAKPRKGYMSWQKAAAILGLSTFGLGVRVLTARIPSRYFGLVSEDLVEDIGNKIPKSRFGRIKQTIVCIFELIP